MGHGKPSRQARAALRYAKRGIPVFPCHNAPAGQCSCGEPDCRSPGKHPRVGEGGFKNATTDAATVRAWWEKWPHANSGVFPGPAGLVVIDADGATGRQTVQEAGLLSEPTFTVTTGRAGGGIHLYFRLPEGVAVTVDSIGPGTTVRCHDGYVIGAGSVHATGTPYEPQGTLDDIVEFPRHALPLLSKSGGTPEKPAPAAPIADVIHEGEGRNIALTRLAGTMRRPGMTEAAILAALLAENQTRCVPPLDAREVEGIARSVSRYEPAAPVTGTPSAAPGPESFPVVRILAGEAPEPPGLLVNDLLVDRDINIWTGFGGSAKSVLALTVAVCVALARPVFGTLAVRRCGAVLLVCPEDGEAAVRMMLDAIASGMDLDAEARAILNERLVMVTDSAMVNLLTDTGRLRRTVREHDAVLVLLDPLRNLLGGADENDNGLAGACLDSLRRDVCREAGAAVQINTHNRKPGKDAGPDPVATVHDSRGGGAWAAGSRLVFGVTKKADAITLSALKSNRLRADIRHELRLTIAADPETPTRWLSCTVTDANSGARSESLTPGVGRDLNPNEQTALGCLDDTNEPGLRLSWSRWLGDSGLNPNTFKSIKDRLLRAGLADAIPTGRLTRARGTEHAYAITDKGRVALRARWVNVSPSGEGVSNG